MAVKSREIPPADRAASPPPGPRRRQRTAAPRWRGCVPGPLMAVVVVVLIPVLAVALVGLSVLGTFYGARGLAVPILTPAQLWADITAARGLFALAACGQGLLTVAQWGGRQLARQDARWWLLYLVSLVVSVWWNWNGFGPPLVAAGVPWLLVVLLIIGGDVLPELALIREDAPASAA